jgi:hypothetical protein
VSRKSDDRAGWTCPDCERTYRISSARPRPVRCPKCEETRTRAEEDSVIEFAAVAMEPGPHAITASGEPTATGETESPVAVERSSAGRSARTAVAQPEAPTRKQFDQMIAHLESINRTMTLFRRFLWAIGVVALLNVLLVGASLIYGMSMLGSFSSLFPGGGSAGRNDASQHLNLNEQRAFNDLPPEVRRNLEAVEDYSNVLNELLEESR